MYNLHLGSEQLEIRDTVRAFVTQEIKPVVLNAARLDAGDRSLPMALLDHASQIGLRTLALSEAAGGAGADNLTCCIVIEELAAGDADIAAVLSETSALAPVLFDRLMTPAQRERFLPQFLADDRFHLALAHREPGTDTALGINYHRPAASRVITTSARRVGDAFILNGVKGPVANAPFASLFAVEVQTSADAGSTTLLVPRQTAGLRVRDHEPATRWYHGACADLVFEDCRVPADNVLGAEGQSLLAAAPGRNSPRSAALNLGIGRAAYEAALDYTQLRVQGGRRIIEHQAIAAILAGIAIKLDVARAAVWRAAWASDHPAAYADRSLPDLPLATIAEVFTAEVVHAVAKEAAECFGAMGVMRDMPLQKYVHDALICLHAGTGVSDARLRIAEGLAGYRRVAPLLAAE
jgi:alkylation response protein AidB-like acyl-CoA dehydrogenase